MGSLSPWHWAILLVVVIVLFGAKKLPDAARSLGKSLRIFKAEVRELHSDTTPESPTTQVQSERIDPEQGHTDTRPA